MQRCCFQIIKVDEIRLVYISLLSVWTWSLFQLLVVNTTKKELTSKAKIEQATEKQSSNEYHVKQSETSFSQSNKYDCEAFDKPEKSNVAEEIEIDLSHDVEKNENEVTAKHDIDEEISSTFQKGNCNYFDCFCFYNEICSLVLSIVFQDASFLLARLLLMIRIRYFQGNIILFTLKNFLFILLVLN